MKAMPPAGETRKQAPAVLPATLRTLASDLRNGADVRALIGAFGRALATVPPLRAFTVNPMEGDVAFGPDHLTLPLIGTGGTLGTMQVAPGGDGGFRAGRLQLAGALAELAAVMIDHALMARTRVAPAEVLAVALGDLPVGVLCFDGTGALVCANPAAQHLLEGRIPVDWPAVWAALAPAGRKAPGVSFILRQGRRAIHVTARRPAPTGSAAVVLQDVGPRIEAFGEAVSAEVYRALVEKRSLVLGVLEAVTGSPAAHEALEAARNVLPSGMRAGPIGAESVAILAPGSGTHVLWPVLRDLVTAHGAGETLRGGVAAMRLAGDTPEALLERAAATLRPVEAELRPGLLVCDRSSVVNDTLSLMLRRDFLVTSSPRWEEALVILQEQPFDGLFLELPGREDGAALEFARRAVHLQPSALPFFVTDVPGPWETADLGFPGRPVFRKPFVVRDVRAVLNQSFAR